MSRYKIQMLEVGYIETFPADFAFNGAYKSGEFLYSPFGFTLLRGAGKNILIDCGINLQTPDRRAFFKASFGSNGHPADEVLETVGLRADDIGAIILSHCHWDHLSGIVYFPKAKVYVQRAEFNRWQETLANPAYAPVFAMVTVADDLKALETVEKEGRLIYFDGECDDLFPGVHIRVSEFGHSFAHQIVLVDTDGVRYAVAGDVCNRPENLLGAEGRPGYMPNVKFAVGSVLNTLHDYDRIMDWAGNDISRILMTHDGERQARFPYVESGLGLKVFDIAKGTGTAPRTSAMLETVISA
jgi:glyoxylase-like metal-dependent hydrolase (beta-lactamase superfamily II)